MHATNSDTPQALNPFQLLMRQTISITIPIIITITILITITITMTIT
jgi:hypothetical protein